jgi:hypothetical protein
MTLYLKDATYIDWQTLAFKSGHLAVGSGDDGGIRFLDTLPPDDERGVDDRVLDCSRRLVTKSFGSGIGLQPAAGDQILWLWSSPYLFGPGQRDAGAV